MSDQEIILEKINLWISKNVLIGGGKVFDFDNLVSRCASDLHVQDLKFLKETLGKAMVLHGHPIFNDNCGKSFFYNIEIKSPVQKNARHSKKDLDAKS